MRSSLGPSARAKSSSQIGVAFIEDAEQPQNRAPTSSAIARIRITGFSSSGEASQVLLERAGLGARAPLIVERDGPAQHRGRLGLAPQRLQQPGAALQDQRGMVAVALLEGGLLGSG